ncbi:MAG: TadE/TadG family type IV pilus assembly protein [Methylocystis sp.]
MKLIELLARFGRDRRGVAAVEFGFVAIPLLFFIIGSMEFSRAYWAKESLHQVAMATARCLAVSNPSCTTASAAQTYGIAEANKWALTLTASNFTTVNSSTTCAGVAGFAVVKISYKFNTVVPILLPWLEEAANLQVSACYPS